MWGYKLNNVYISSGITYYWLTSLSSSSPKFRQPRKGPQGSKELALAKLKRIVGRKSLQHTGKSVSAPFFPANSSPVFFNTFKFFRKFWYFFLYNYIGMAGMGMPEYPMGVETKLRKIQLNLPLFRIERKPYTSLGNSKQPKPLSIISQDN